MELKLVVALSVLAQLGAAILALRLIRVTGRRAAWTFISLAVFLMAVRRVIPLYQIFSGAPPPRGDLAFEIVGLVAVASAFPIAILAIGIPIALLVRLVMWLVGAV